MHTEDFYILSHHQEPENEQGSLWNSLDLNVWAGYSLSGLILASVMLFFGSFIRKPVELSEVLLRMTVGFLEPHAIQWYPRVKGVKILLLMYLLYGISFNMFYNVEFRSSLITQKFPSNVESSHQVDVASQGHYIHYKNACIVDPQ